MTLRRVFLVLSLCAAVATASADVRLPAIFGDHMVLQRDGEVPVWGTADPGESVTVTAGTARGTAEAGSDGKWVVRLAGLPVSSQPIEVTVSGKNTITYHDVLVGDVWVCSGQSNMEFGIRNDVSAAEEVPKADRPQIRLFFVPKNPLPAPASDLVLPAKIPTQSCWLVCSPETVVHNGWNGFSAVGYFFGRDIHAYTKAPVGLIGTYWGGTPAQAWTSLPALQGVPALKRYADQGADQAENGEKNDRHYAEVTVPWWTATSEKWKQDNKAAWDDYELALQQWTENPAGKPKPRDPSPVMPKKPSENPEIASVLFNGMVAPLIPYAIKGVVWYQGENNSGEPVKYATLLPTLIGDWRARWGRGDFPFLIVQLANFTARKPDPSESNWAVLRESQAKAAALPNAGLAVAIDLGEADNVHPKDKVDVGARLALAARKVAYGDAHCVASGPTFKAISIDGGKVRVSFDNVGQGLAVGVPPPHFHPGEPRPDTATLRGFSLAGSDGVFYWADAAIDGESVVLSSGRVSAPLQVRYAWASNPDCNLYNRDGLPAVPFRTDSLPVGEDAAARK